MRVIVNYFKQNGKWYSEGEYDTNKVQLFEIWEELREMFNNRKRPGLVDGIQEFNTLVNVPEHPHNHPYIIMTKYLDY